jgi:uncharacterized protein YbjT (DUF2867 family)
MKVLVPGGTGLLGRAVVAGLVGAGHEVRVLSRDPSRVVASPHVEVRRGDLRDPESLTAAMAGVDVVVNCATDPRSAQDVDVAGTANLATAMQAGAVGHLVQVSIVGVDRIPLRFYRSKRQAELVVEQQGVPWTIQRATQFHQFIDTMLGMSARLPVVPTPRGLRFQPIAVEDLAARLVQHVADGPAGMAPSLGGPEVLTHGELATTWLRAHGRRRVLLPVPLPGKLGRAFREGANLSPEHRSHGMTWQEYLDALDAPHTRAAITGRDAG